MRILNGYELSLAETCPFEEKNFRLRLIDFSRTSSSFEPFDQYNMCTDKLIEMWPIAC